MESIMTAVAEVNKAAPLGLAWELVGDKACSLNYSQTDYSLTVIVTQLPGGTTCKVNIFDRPTNQRHWVVPFRRELLASLSRALSSYPSKETLFGVLLAFDGFCLTDGGY